MKHRARAALATAAAFACAGAAQAADGRFAAAVTGGTLGIGPEARFRPSPAFGVRANATFLGISHSFDSDDIRYRGNARLRSTGVMVDLFPFKGSFRLSAGLRVNGNRVRVKATPTGPVEIDDTTYTPAQVGTISGRATVKRVAPALTIGWGGNMRRGFVFGTEAGVLFQGRLRVRDFRASNGLVSPADLEAERQSIQSDVDSFKVYPIVQVSIGYRF